MDEVETLFRYLMILENIVFSLPAVKEEELSTLQSLERTVMGAMKYPLIGLYISRIATFGANAPQFVYYRNRPKKKRRERENLYHVDV